MTGRPLLTPEDDVSEKLESSHSWVIYKYSQSLYYVWHFDFIGSVPYADVFNYILCELDNPIFLLQNFDVNITHIYCLEAAAVSLEI